MSDRFKLTMHCQGYQMKQAEVILDRISGCVLYADETATLSLGGDGAYIKISTLTRQPWEVLRDLCEEDLLMGKLIVEPM